MYVHMMCSFVFECGLGFQECATILVYGGAGTNPLGVLCMLGTHALFQQLAALALSQQLLNSVEFNKETLLETSGPKSLKD